MPTIHLVIKGKVQGVFYRANTKKKAEELGISGWVKNTAEGNVELMATGSDDTLEAFKAWCHIGPQKALVTELVIIPCLPMEFNSFSIIR
jgi:acylphosphatase